jgi:methionine synthase II (cobalamin-independent)
MASIGSFQNTATGSFPHHDDLALSEWLAANLDIPCWPQLPRRDFRERMYVQYSTGMPAIKLDIAKEKIYFDTTGDFSGQLEEFYGRYLSDDVEAFALDPGYAVGFYTMLEILGSHPGSMAKGQITGPISFGLTVTDQDLRASLYNDQLADAITKHIALAARWQARKLSVVRPQVIVFVDEPYMASFGSAYISLSRERAISILNEVFDAIHMEGALVGVHCCANTDWSVLMATTADILNIDAYGYLSNLALYPLEVTEFLDRGGLIDWGIVPNNRAIYRLTPSDLAHQLWDGLEMIAKKAQARELELTLDTLAQQSLITTSCGLGPTTVPIADRALDTLVELSRILG